MKRVALAMALLTSSPALAATDGGAGRTSPSASARGPAPPAASAGRAYSTCVEQLGEMKERPKLSDSFPSDGLSGYALTLEVVVEHGKGETVLPSGLSVRFDSEEAAALEQAGFALPHPDGGAGPSRQVEKKSDRAVTTVRIPFVALPSEAGRQRLELPPVPIAVARASGEVMTLCTKPHAITIEDPIANLPEATPKPNPRARRQLEEWTSAKHATFVALIALLAGALIAWLVSRWMRRPRPEPPPPPPRPPWEVALEDLFDLKNSGLIEQGRHSTYFDRISYIVRRYLGDRYGFDGLESTTGEVLALLSEMEPPVAVLSDIEEFLSQADLVKFAKVSPSEGECQTAMSRGEAIVHRTIPPRSSPEARDDEEQQSPPGPPSEVLP